MLTKDKVLSKTLQIVNGKLLRNVEDVSAIERYIQVLSKKGYIDKNVINTTVYSKEDKIVEHEILKYIIHSGEYTESMAYDVNTLSLNMAIDLEKEGVYAYDLLPHNFTFYNGNWFLYDFDSFQLSPEKSITQIRGFFKIIFSNYEILKLITRDKLGYYYLTRYRIEDIFHTIPIYRWLYLFLNQSICNILYKLKQYKLTYFYLKKLFKKYSKNECKKYYKYDESKTYLSLNEILQRNNISSAFCIGKESANWAINNEIIDSNIQKLVYIDDYQLCDDYYNFVVRQKFKNIIPAVLYPLVDDNDIPINYKYRALYDSYAQERFYSDCVVALDFFDENKKDLFINLAKFTSNILIVSADNYSKDEIGYLRTLFFEVEVNGDLVVASGKRNNNVPVSNKAYSDGNRGPDARRQSKKVDELIKIQK